MFLPLSFFNRPPELVAPDILGQLLIHYTPEGIVRSGLITEVEAYLHEDDPAAHSARGPTHATRALRMGPGTLYIHPMRAYVGLDIVTLHGSLLLRALHPVENLLNIADGPGKLCRAVAITKNLYGLNITSDDCPLRLMSRKPPLISDINIGPRIGITKNKEALLRFSYTPV